MRIGILLAVFWPAFFCLSSNSFGETARWTPNDLSILMPLPQTADSSDLLGAESAGAKGSLIPWGRFQSLPMLAPFFRKKDVEYKTLRLVSLRFDPCFPAVPGRCQAQIRIIWQPLIETRTGALSLLTVDAGVHTFYDLTDTEYANVTKELRALRDAQGISTEGPLWVHPVLEKQGLNGPFNAGLKDLVLKYAGEQNLSRMTFMLMRGGSILWAFGGINFKDGVATTINIPRLGGTEARPAELQTFVNRSLTNDDFKDSDLKPAPAGADIFNFLMRDSRFIRPVEDRAELAENLASIYRLENPAYHNSETSDCVSCHVAEASRTYALNRFGKTAFPPKSLEYRSVFDLRNQSSKISFTANLHSFGYFQQQPAISQRMINEAAAVAERMNLAK